MPINGWAQTHVGPVGYISNLIWEFQSSPNRGYMRPFYECTVLFESVGYTVPSSQLKGMGVRGSLQSKYNCGGAPEVWCGAAKSSDLSARIVGFNLYPTPTARK